MDRYATRAQRLAWSGFVLICGSFFLGYSIWQTLMLSEPVPAAANLGIRGYFLVTTVAFYCLAALLLFLGVRAVRRNLARPREA